MNQLNDNWLTSGLIDFEYKKFILLAYLQNVKKQFDGHKLYPGLNDLVFHYKNLQSIKKNKQLLYKNFPEKISKADFAKLKVSYEKIVQDGDVMKVLEEIIYYSLPKIKGILEEGKTVYELIESKIEITPVGILPIYPEYGYLFVNEYKVKETRIYHYKITIFESSDEKFRGINTTFIETVRKGIGTTYENIKLQLIKKNKSLSSPAAFILNSKVPCPLEESLMPVAKRALVRKISKMAA
ncbi:MAG: hypothetical protein KTR26_21605 [Flammeovirgaceae bacterium]|nr:hypothetical protein [Flammeovirgaceae bacterium]